MFRSGLKRIYLMRLRKALTN